MSRNSQALGSVSCLLQGDLGQAVASAGSETQRADTQQAGRCGDCRRGMLESQLLIGALSNVGHDHDLVPLLS